MKKSLISIISFIFLGVSISVCPKENHTANAIDQSYTTNKATYYNGITETCGLPLLGRLHDLLCTTHAYYSSYNDCKDPDIIYSIEPGTNENFITDFYAQEDINKEWYTKVGGWNREHVWCQSLSIDVDTGNNLWGTKGGGSDLHHIRPIEYSSNSSRNNHPYGLVGDDFQLVYAKGRDGLQAHVSGKLNTKLDIFEPNDEVKGDVARIIFYVYTHYSDYRYVGGTTNGSGCTTYGHLDITNIINTEEKSEEAAWNLLLNWNEIDPVSQQEIYRNEAISKYQGNRNPFIDNPDYANKIWGHQEQEIPSNVDRITASDLGTTNSYRIWENKSFNTPASYSGKSLGTSYLQINGSKNCIIFSNRSGGLIKKISFSVFKDENHKNAGSINAYFSNTPFDIKLDISAVPSFKYDDSKTLSVVNDGVIEVDKNYLYVCLVPSDNVAYLNYIEFTWEKFDASSICSTPQTMTGLSFSYSESDVTKPSYVKLEENLDDFSGRYLIVSSYADVCLNASLGNVVDAAFNYSEVDLTNGVIRYDTETVSQEVEIIKNGEYYSIKIGGNYYIGNNQNSSNGLSCHTSINQFKNTIHINNDGTADIVAIASSSTSYLRYNSNTKDNRFRYYKADTYTAQKPIYLYRFDEIYSEKEYEPSNVSMTFGALVDYDEYRSILSTYNVTGFGMFVAYKKNLQGKSIEEIYHESKENIDSTSWLTANSIIYSARVLKNEDELPCYRTDATGLPTLEDGEYVTWKVKINLKEASYTSKIASVAYMIIGGEYCFFKQRETSVSSLCLAYLNEDISLDESTIGALSTLARLDGNIL